MMRQVALSFKSKPGTPDEEMAELVARLTGGWLPSGEDGMDRAREVVKWARGILKGDPTLEKYYAGINQRLKARGVDVPDVAGEIAAAVAAEEAEERGVDRRD